MNTYTRLALGTALLFGAGVGSTTHAADAYWGATDNIAHSTFENGIVVAVVFDERARCNQSLLAVSGNPDIVRIGMEVDGVSYGNVEAYMEGDLAVAILTERGLSAIKNGSRMTIFTDRGYLPLDLSGSSAALVTAYENCMQPPAHKLLFPTGRLVEF